MKPEASVSGLSRRQAVLAPFVGGIAALGLNGYAFAYAPAVQLNVTRYRIAPRQWALGPALRIAVLTDLHFGEPFVSLGRLDEIVAATNSLAPDLICVLGDFEPGHRFVSRPVPRADWARSLATLKAPLGVHTVLGNHDWWSDAEAQLRCSTVPLAGRALMDAGLPVLDNEAVPLVKEGRRFWVVGLADQLAYHVRGRHWIGRHDLAGALAQVSDAAPILMLAHEPDIFVNVPDSIALTLSGHTHGGQVRLLGYSPLVPSDYGNRYAYGHVVEGGRHLVVSGGLGPGKLPVRLGVPPEIVLIELLPPGRAA
ncbi:MAG: metallophosphoesterase [Hyphomicrobiales bacterium]|nr:metallophosphoesterase [Hyphomicrobiales bacterium]